MPLTFHPRRSNQLCTIVPLSTTAPIPVESFHHRMDPRPLPGNLAQKETWAKCNMLATVSLDRLDRVMVGKTPGGKGIYVAEQAVLANDLEVIRQGGMAALGVKVP